LDKNTTQEAMETAVAVAVVHDDGTDEHKLAVARAVYEEEVQEVAEVKVSMEELCVRACPDGARRRALLLRDELFCGRPLSLNRGLEDVEALLVRDADRGMTLLHWAAFHGRARALKDLVAFSQESLFLDRCHDYGALTDDRGLRAIDHAKTDDCRRLLLRLSDDDDDCKPSPDGLKRRGSGGSFFDDDKK